MKSFKLNLVKRAKNRFFWVSMFSVVAITGQVFGLYQVPEGYEAWVNSVLIMLTMAGVIQDPTTPGIGDKE